MKTLVLFSGGIDSTTLLAKAVRERESVEAITIQYGQRHEEQELRTSRKISRYYGVDQNIVDLKNIFTSDRNSVLLHKEKEMPHVTYQEIKGVSPTYVPLRNPVFIVVSAAIGMMKEYDELWVGVHAEDAINDAYPDCREDVIGSLASAIHIGSYYKMRVKAPLQYMLKKDILEYGEKLDVPYELTYSCYKGEELHCGECPTCKARRKAFIEAGIKDPTEYQK